MTVLETSQWSADAFVRAWEAGVFGDARVELVEGEVWPVPIGTWHGAVTFNIARQLPNNEWRVSGASLPSGESVPDPDVWVHRRGAEPVGRLGSTGRIASWNPDDVALVVEVADTSLTADLDIKARVYRRAGYSTYWVVHREGTDILTDPHTTGYRRRISYGPGENVPCHTGQTSRSPSTGYSTPTTETCTWALARSDTLTGHGMGPFEVGTLGW